MFERVRRALQLTAAAALLLCPATAGASSHMDAPLITLDDAANTTDVYAFVSYKGGVKYQKENDYKLNERGTGESEKAAAAQIFYQKYKEAEANPIYKHLKADWKKKYG